MANLMSSDADRRLMTRSGEVARATSERGELVLRRRVDDALELRVNGVFVMDTAHTSSERLLARTALANIRESGPLRLADSLTVLIGGLGLGYTLQEVLADARVRSVIVAEIEPTLVEWHRHGLIPETRTVCADARVNMRIGDVRAVAGQLEADSCDLILLDVDNGPGFLVYDENAAIYRRSFLGECRRLIRPGGVTAIWSADASPDLAGAIVDVFGDCSETAVPVTLGHRDTTYHVFAARW
ncbi:MAG: hypothetical protein ACR2KG_00725 [Nocardioidaceae bacterium]